MLGKIIKKYVLNEIRLKILALVLAAILWFSMTYVGDKKIGYCVPVVFENLSKSFAVTEVDTDDVLITLDGPLSVLKNLGPEDIKVSVNLSKVREGRHNLSIKKSDILVPSGVKIESLKPDYVVVEVDKIVEKQLRTVVKLDDKWIGIYRVVSWSPKRVVIEGPEGLIDKRGPIETIPVDGDLKQRQEVLNVPLNIKAFAPGKIKPEMIKVVLKRIDE